MINSFYWKKVDTFFIYLVLSMHMLNPVFQHKFEIESFAIYHCLISCFFHHYARYYAVLKPLNMMEHRGKIMISIAWILSAVCSAPQVLMKFLFLSRIRRIRNFNLKSCRLSYFIVRTILRFLNTRNAYHLAHCQSKET